MSNVDTVKQHEFSFRDVFAKTGHETLRALLLVSGGATIAYLSFLGILIGDQKRIEALGVAILQELISAMEWYIYSVAAALLCYGGSYIAHAAIYYSSPEVDISSISEHLKKQIAIIARAVNFVVVFLGFSCLYFFLKGSFEAAQAFASATGN